MALALGKRPLFDTVNSRKKIINGQGATRTLSADESGSTVVFDRAAGIIYTLPLAVPGLTYEFVISTTITSNNAKVITGAATEFLIGDLVSADADASPEVTTAFAGNGSTHIAITMNGTTTGGVLGTVFRVTCLSATRWIVEGLFRATGAPATPFATS